MEPSYQDYKFGSFKKKKPFTFKNMINTLYVEMIDAFRSAINSPKSRLNQLEARYEREHREKLVKEQREYDAQFELYKSEQERLEKEKFIEDLRIFDPLFKNDFERIKKDITREITHNVKSFSEQKLPAESREIISHIREYYQLTVSNVAYDKISLEDKLDLENLYKKRFPQVLEEYINISPRHREKLVIHNESPDLLLLDSLQTIHARIAEIFEMLEDSKLFKMKATNHYLKNI